VGTKEGSLNLGKNPVVQLLAKKYEATPGQQVTAEEIVGTAAGMLNRAKSAAEVEAVAQARCKHLRSAQGAGVQHVRAAARRHADAVQDRVRV
jgi:hypothetical protein